MKLVNAFSAGMLPAEDLTNGKVVVLEFRSISLATATRLLGSRIDSAVGHANTAEVLSTLLGVPVAANRIEVKLQPGDRLMIAQLSGRLPEGKILSREEVEKLDIAWLIVHRTQ